MCKASCCEGVGMLEEDTLRGGRGGRGRRDRGKRVGEGLTMCNETIPSLLCVLCFPLDRELVPDRFLVLCMLVYVLLQRHLCLKKMEIKRSAFRCLENF